MEFRTLRADEIDVRVGSVGAKGVTLLLYKDARCDQNILDETVGQFNWQRHHSRDNANCIVSIWDDVKNQWIEKEDTGTESYTEKEKGLASDSFKRACFNWGIGRELYTAPFLFVQCETLQNNRKYELTNDSKKLLKGMKVSQISYFDGTKNIKDIEIINSKGDVLCQSFASKKAPVQKKETAEERAKLKPDDKITAGGVDFIKNLCSEVGSKEKDICDYYKVNSFSDMTIKDFQDACSVLERKKAKQNE